MKVFGLPEVSMLVLLVMKILTISHIKYLKYSVTLFATCEHLIYVLHTEC